MIRVRIRGSLPRGKWYSTVKDVDKDFFADDLLAFKPRGQSFRGEKPPDVAVCAA